ncbi:hypothetical protein [Methylovulum sp.]|uniref:hypothetical protein n=1 Tax=Methylovulum sp. TaxID=1916980 RepID=UPI002631D202|nr:hypothetical protein [Methylovulum sp.]MDD5123584.1 hypothetical protein [Methylovulum sp.]
MPFLNSLHKRLMVDGALRNMMVVDGQITQQSLLFLGGVKLGLLEGFADPSIKTFHHLCPRGYAIGLRGVDSAQEIDFLAVLRLMLYRSASFRSDNAESLISWRMTGGCPCLGMDEVAHVLVSCLAV